MRSLLVFAFVLLFSGGYGQYYFNDMVSTQTSNDQYKSLRSNKIRKITAASYEADNSKTEGFALEEEISMDGKRIILSTSISSGKSSVTNRFYELSKLRKTQSINNGIDSKTEYTYLPNGLVQKIVFTTTDTAKQSTLIEAHEWMYNEAGQPQSMLKIKDKTDTTVIELIKDEQGLIIEERWKRKNRVVETYYYYYDTNKQLTDIVRYNTRIKKLIPEFQYEYDANGRISKMTQLLLSTNSYFIWQYVYNEKGLKQKEVGFDKERRMIGRIEYTYE
ncbi:MAG: hypothetical protein ABI581_05705 [Sediminibacterium sp.]